MVHDLANASTAYINGDVSKLLFGTAAECAARRNTEGVGLTTLAHTCSFGFTPLEYCTGCHTAAVVIAQAIVPTAF
jgi:hypothetical protein